MDVWLLIYRDGCMSVKIRVSIQVTVRSPDPKPKKHMERSTRAIPLYHIVILCLSQPSNVRHLPGPPVYTFFGEMANHLGWGTPKHTALMTCLYMVVSSRIIIFFRFTWKWDFTTPPHRHMHARYKVYVSRLLLRSYDFQLKWWCTMVTPSTMVHLLSLPPNWIYDNLWPAVPVTLVPPRSLVVGR